MQKETYTPASSSTPCLPGFSKSVKVIISQEVMDVCDWLHAKVGAIEWSGVIFYIVEGDIDNMETMKIIVKHFYPLDVGTASGTGFNFDDKFTKAYSVFPNALQMNMGLMHTHHSMGLFFSQTDENELQKNSESFNFYLSVITNFTRKFIGKLGIVIRPESPNWTAVNTKGESFRLALESKPKTYHIPCDVSEETTKVEIPWLTSLYEDIKVKKPSYTQYGGDGIYTWHEYDQEPWKKHHNIPKNSTSAPANATFLGDKEPRRLSSIADLFNEGVRDDVEKRREEARKKVEEFEKKTKSKEPDFIAKFKENDKKIKETSSVSFALDAFDILFNQSCIIMEELIEQSNYSNQIFPFWKLLSSAELAMFQEYSEIAFDDQKKYVNKVCEFWTLLFNRLKVEEFQEFATAFAESLRISIIDIFETIDDDKTLMSDNETIDEKISFDLTIASLKELVSSFPEKPTQTFVFSIIREMTKI